MLFNNFDDDWGRFDILFSKHGQHIDEWLAIHRQVGQRRHVFFADDFLLRIILYFFRHFEAKILDF